MPSPSPLNGLRPRSPLARRLGAALLLVAIVLTFAWVLDGGGRAPARPATASGCTPEAPATARPIALPLPEAIAWRDLEGTLVCVTHPLVVAEVYELPTRGWVLAGAQRPTAATTDRVLAAGTLRVRPAAADLRSGDALAGAWGTLRLDDRGALLDDARTDPERRNPRPTAPPAVGGDGDLRLAAVNLRNWFWHLGDRGASTATERDAQLAKLASMLVPLDADVLALAEVANDDGRALDELLRRVNAEQQALGRSADAAYAAVSPPPPDRGADAIRVAIAYRPARLTLVGAAVDRARVHDRPPLAATFDAPNGERFSVVAVHHRAKGGCPTSGDVDRGAGCWDLRRDAQTEALLDFVADLAAQVGDADVLVLGDLNAYRHEAPARRFADAGWSLAVDAMPAGDAYSYVYFGRAGALDHAAASPSAAPRVTGAAFWRVNADEPPGADATRPTPFRASDHDPLLVAFGVGR